MAGALQRVRPGKVGRLPSLCKKAARLTSACLIEPSPGVRLRTRAGENRSLHPTQQIAEDHLSPNTRRLGGVRAQALLGLNHKP